SPVRHPAKRRRIKTVLQEIMYRAAKVIKQARSFIIDFGRNAAVTLNVFNHVKSAIRRSYTT
ncbi:MAG: IS1380 family transposase, partial [Thiotrichales bacterium]|nr:IS1380 family transposase [Thiotrichales bacterium]